MRKILIVVMGIFTLNNTMAQSGIHVGPKMFGGASFIIRQKSCDLMENVPDDSLHTATLAYNMKFGYFIGGTFAYFFQRNMGVEIDLLYSNAGQNYSDVYCKEFCMTRYEVSKVVNMSHLQIPLMFKWVFGQDGFIKGYLAGGPNFGIVLGGSETGRIKHVINATETVIKDTIIEVPNVLSKTKGFDLALNAEGGIHLYFKRTFYLNLGLNTCISLMDINTALLQNCISRSDNGVYRTSRNFRFGFVASLNFVFKNKERRIRWRNGSF